MNDVVDGYIRNKFKVGEMTEFKKPEFLGNYSFKFSIEFEKSINYLLTVIVMYHFNLLQ